MGAPGNGRGTALDDAHAAVIAARQQKGNNARVMGAALTPDIGATDIVVQTCKPNLIKSLRSR
jgi:hypothetical protein